MRMRLLYAAGAIAGLGLWGAVLAGAQDPHGGHGPGHEQPGADRAPRKRWSGVNPTRTATARYIPQPNYTAHIARPPATTVDGRPIPPLPMPVIPGAPKAPEPGTPVGPAVGPSRGPGAGDEPFGPSIERSLTEPSAYWSNYWEVYRRGVLGELRGWKQSRHGMGTESWDDPLMQLLLKALLDRDPWVSAEAAVALGGSGRPEAFPLLERLARGEHARASHIVRSGAVLALGLCPDPRADAVLQEIVAEYNPATINAKAQAEREQLAGNAPGQPAANRGGVDEQALSQHEYRAAYALTGMAFSIAPEHLDYLIGLVKRNDLPQRMRVAAMSALAQHEQPEAVELMISAVVSPHLPHQLRGTAAVGIARTRATDLPGTKAGTRAAAVLFEVLPLTGRDSRSTRLGVAAGLSYCGGVQDLTQMRAWLDGWAAVPHMDPEKALPGQKPEGDTTVRSAFLVAMARIAQRSGDAKALAATRTMLEAHCALKWPAGIRGFAALSLGLLQDPSAAPVLRTMLTADPDTHVRGGVAVALGLLDDGESLGAMIKLLGQLSRDPDKQADAAYVIEGLGLLSDAEAKATLRKRFAEAPDQHQRRAAGLALAIAGDRSIVDQLIGDLASRDQWRGPGAMVALSYYDQSVVRAQIMKAATSENADVRRAAVKVIGSWVHDEAQPRLVDFVAAGVFFPNDGAHLYFDLLTWQ